MIQCVNLTNQRTDSGCDEVNKPEARKICQVVECPKQEAGK